MFAYKRKPTAVAVSYLDAAINGRSVNTDVMYEKVRK